MLRREIRRSRRRFACLAVQRRRTALRFHPPRRRRYHHHRRQRLHYHAADLCRPNIPRMPSKYDRTILAVQVSMTRRTGMPASMSARIRAQPVVSVRLPREAGIALTIRLIMYARSAVKKAWRFRRQKRQIFLPHPSSSHLHRPRRLLHDLFPQRMSMGCTCIKEKQLSDLLIHRHLRSQHQNRNF